MLCVPLLVRTIVYGSSLACSADEGDTMPPLSASRPTVMAGFGGARTSICGACSSIARNKNEIACICALALLWAFTSREHQGRHDINDRTKATIKSAKHTWWDNAPMSRIRWRE